MAFHLPSTLLAIILVVPASCRKEGVADESTPPLTAVDEATPAQPPEPVGPIPTIDELQRSYEAANGHAYRLEPVEEGLDRFLREHPDDPTALNLLAQVHLERGRIDESPGRSRAVRQPVLPVADSPVEDPPVLAMGSGQQL